MSSSSGSRHLAYLFRGRTAALGMAVLIAACDLPHDAEGTLRRVERGALRVGVAENQPWVAWSGDSAIGVEPTMISELARELHARPKWRHGAESTLLQALHRRELDLVIGGLQADSPWKTDVALTKPYTQRGGDGQRVIALASGENAWLMRVEHFLSTRGRAVADSILLSAR